MKEEIKEILEKLKENISIVSVEEEHLLLDYITNLQQTLDETVDNYTEEYNLRKHLDFKLNILQEENERLKAREQECIDKYLAESKYRGEVEGKYVSAKYVIDELEKDLKQKIEEDKLNIISNSHWLYVLDKLKELKGE